jgi:hypothetical protein
MCQAPRIGTARPNDGIMHAVYDNRVQAEKVRRARQEVANTSQESEQKGNLEVALVSL